MAPLLAEGTPEWPWLCAQDERIYIVEIDTFACSHCVLILSTTATSTRKRLSECVRNGAFNA